MGEAIFDALAHRAAADVRRAHEKDLLSAVRPALGLRPSRARPSGGFLQACLSASSPLAPGFSARARIIEALRVQSLVLRTPFGATRGFARRTRGSPGLDTGVTPRLPAGPGYNYFDASDTKVTERRGRG
jgi:hypothetical protein